MSKEKLIFCPLGGSGEIGGNMNLYAYGEEDNQKWIIVDIGVSFADDYEGSLEQRRTIIYTLNFQMKIQFFGNIGPSSIVRKATVPIFDIKSGLIADSDIKLETITVTPNPSDTFGTADSSFGFIEDIKMTQDSGTV